MSRVYPESVQKAVKALCKELAKHHPEIFEKRYNSMGWPDDDGDSFQNRMEMGVYLELLKAGQKLTK